LKVRRRSEFETTKTLGLGDTLFWRSLGVSLAVTSAQ